MTAMVMGAVAALLVVPASASAWSLSKGTNGCVISREASDTTGTVSIRRYWDYKGGSDWVYSTAAALRPSSGGAYNSNDYVAYLGETVVDSVEIALKPSYRCQLIAVEQTTPYAVLQSFAVLNEPLSVSLPSTQSVAVSSMPTVSASMVGTSTSAVTLAGISDPAVLAGGALLLIVGGVYFGRSWGLT